MSDTRTEEFAGLALVEERLRVAMRDIHKPFLAAAEGLRDLSPQFWVWLGIVSGRAASDRPGSLLDTVATAHAVLGAAGDFGDGTPHGQALKTLYELHNDLRRSLAERTGR